MFGHWTSCTAYPTAPEVVCFGGSSNFGSPNFEANTFCEAHNIYYSLSGAHLDSSSTNDEKKIWYSIGGNGENADTWWTVKYVIDFKTFLSNGGLSTKDFIGIVFDIEVPENVFQISMNLLSFSSRCVLAEQLIIQFSIICQYFVF